MSPNMPENSNIPFADSDKHPNELSKETFTSYVKKRKKKKQKTMRNTKNLYQDTSSRSVSLHIDFSKLSFLGKFHLHIWKQPKPKLIRG